MPDDEYERIICNWYRSYGMETSVSPKIDVEKFEAARPAVRARFIRQWKRSITRLEGVTKEELHEKLYPLHGSLFVFRDSLLRDMKGWLHVWKELDRYLNTGKKYPEIQSCGSGNIR